MHLRAALRLSLPTALAACLLGCPPSNMPAGGAQQAPASPAAASSAGGSAAATPAAPEKKPFDRATAKTPWVDAKVGDYCVYKMHKPSEMELRCEVTAVADDSVTWKRSVGGKDRGSTVQDLADAEDHYQEPTSLDALDGAPQEQEIEINGKQLKVLVVKRTTSSGSTEAWVTRDLPPFMTGAGGWATVKSLKDGELIQELTDFGHPE